MHLISENNELFEEYTRHLFGVQEVHTFRNQLLRLLSQLFQTDYVSLLFFRQDKLEEFSHPKDPFLKEGLLSEAVVFNELFILSNGDQWPKHLNPLRQEGINLLVLIPVLNQQQAAVLLAWKLKKEIAFEEKAEIKRLKGRLDELLSFYQLLEQNQQLKENSIKSSADLAEGAADSAEEALSSADKLSYLFLSTFPGLLLLFNKEGKIIKWNSGAESILGYTAQEIEQAPVIQIFAEESRELSKKIIDEAFTTGYASMESKLLDKRGIERSVSCNLYTHQIGEDNLLLLQGIDISHSKQLESSLRKISNHLRHIINNDVLSYIKWSKEFEVLDWSGKSAETFGWSLPEVKGKHILSFDFIHPEEVSRVEKTVQEFQEGSRDSAKYDLKHVTKNNRDITVEWYTTAIRDEEGNITSFLSLGNETSERTRMEQDLVETNQKLQAVLSSSPVSIVTFDLKGRIQSWNRAAEQIFGYTAEEVIGREAPYLPADTKEEQQKMLNHLKAGGRITDLVLQRKHKDQSHLLIKVNAGPIRDRWGNISGIIAAQEDVTEQERLRERLSEEKVYRESILQNLQSYIIACDAEGRINLYNEAAKSVIGPDVIGALPEGWGNALDIYTADGLRKIDKEEMPLYRALQGEVVRDEELMLITKKAAKRVFSCNASPIRDSRGVKIGALLSLEDITEKKRSLHEFVDEKEFSDAILSSLPGVFYVINTKGGFVRWNSRFNKISQYTSEELVSMRATAVIAEEDRKKVANAIKEVFEQGESSVEALFLTKEGQKIPYLFSGHAFWKNGEHYLVGMGIDISERKLAEEGHKRLTSILEATSDFVGMYNQEKRCLYLNEEGKTLCGISDLKDLSLYDCCPAWMADMIDLEIIPKANESGIWRGEAALQDKWGQEIPVSLVLIAHSSAQGKYYSMIARDISHHLQYEKKLTDQNEELKKINEELDRFVYSASHDLRAPLVSILGLINIARLSLDSHEFPQYLDLMESRVSRLDTFIKDIEDFSRNSRLSVKQDEINFNALIEESREDLKFTKGAELVRLEKEIRLDAPFYTDKSRLMIIMNNLISNAIRYSNPERKDPYIRVVVEANEKQATIKVEDNGLGIATEYQDKIFDMFFRASASNVGSGLGLFIVKETIIKLGGTIKVASKLGEYTTFTIQIPNLKA